MHSVSIALCIDCTLAQSHAKSHMRPPGLWTSTFLTNLKYNNDIS